MYLFKRIFDIFRVPTFDSERNCIHFEIVIINENDTNVEKIPIEIISTIFYVFKRQTNKNRQNSY